MKSKLIKKGSITVEAAIILPFFIITVISFVFVMKVYFVNEIIQNAISGATREMSVYGLLYYKTNAEEIVGSIERFTGSDKVSDTLGDNWLTSGIEQFGKAATDYARTQIVLVPAAKVLVKKHLESGFNNSSADTGLKNLNLVQGFDSIDFSGSSMLSDGKSIDITADYEMKFPFLADLLPKVNIHQTASACIWAGEDGVDDSNVAGEESQSQYVWDMTNIKRGREIRKLQGANLPFNFPVIAKFENGTATSIKSLNADEAYYKNSRNLELQIVGYINKLDKFNGDTCGNVSVTSSEIYRKELVLVIPETDLLPNQQAVINQCIYTAQAKGITLKLVKAYGKQGNSQSENGRGEAGNDDESN